MEDKKRGGLFRNLDERKLSVIVHSLFSSWMLAFLFEGQIFLFPVRPFPPRPGRHGLWRNRRPFCRIAALRAVDQKQERGKTAAFMFLSLFHHCFGVLFLPALPVLGGRPPLGFPAGGRLRGGLGFLPEERHAEKRAHQNGGGCAHLLKPSDDRAQHGGRSHIARHRPRFLHPPAFGRLPACAAAPR